MKISERGLEQLIVEEGEVLKAYKDPVGIWTIGVGLTKASGVVVPKAGMVITRGESRRLLALALERNYEPAVVKAMPGASQAAFDGGVSFHFNTGAIAKASWVKAWRAGKKARPGLAKWNKAGGKVLRGLVSRREREADLIDLGRYSAAAKSPTPIRDPGPVIDMTDPPFLPPLEPITQETDMPLGDGKILGSIVGNIIERTLNRQDVPIANRDAPAAAEKVKEALDISLATRETALVPLKGWLLSKLNWTQLVSLAAMAAAFFGLDVSPETLTAIIAGIAAAGNVLSLIIKTFFTGTITPQSVGK